MNKRPLLGTTYSYREVRYLQLDEEKSFSDLFSFGFDLVRLGAYWNEIQPTKDSFDTSYLERMLMKCEQAELPVLLTVGMKAPRWPEFYFPPWLSPQTPEEAEKYVGEFIHRVVDVAKKYSSVRWWQVENEPRDPIDDGNLSITRDFLEKEIALVRSLDKRDIVLTLWGNNMAKRGFLSPLDQMADIVGIDLYYRHPTDNGYSTPSDLSLDLSRLEHPLWITELQAEPWEKEEDVKLSLQTPSISGELIKENVTQVLKYHPEVVLFWGFEYWLWRKERRDESLWKAAKEIVHTK